MQDIERAQSLLALAAMPGKEFSDAFLDSRMFLHACANCWLRICRYSPRSRAVKAGSRGLWSSPLERRRDRKSTRLNSSHGYISYAVFCLKKKKTKNTPTTQNSRTSHRWLATRSTHQT